ncbi:MAG: PaaI family thioesterase [Burkholderiaceae bacterium]|jgi:uncharacterized protein (TIGR00369 family)|nr:PaaI family thioesterase [Burkholderiaceae bacterium]
MAKITETPFLNELGVELILAEGGVAETRMLVQPQHTNSWHVVHGGVIMTMLDITMSRAARSLVPGETSGATVEMKTSFFQPGGKTGSLMIGKGRVSHRSTTLYYCEAEIWKAESLVAKAMGTFKVFRRSDIARRLNV